MVAAPYLLINGGVRVYKRGTHELLGFAYAQELPGGNGQIQRWLLRETPGEYDFKPWENGPQGLEQWQDMVVKEPPSAFWGLNPTLNGIWASGAFYIMAQSTVVHYTEGMDTSTLPLIEPKYPFVPNVLAASTAGGRARLSAGSEASAGTRSPQAPRSPATPHRGASLDIAPPPRPSYQLVVGDKTILQNDLVGHCFGHTDIEEIAKTKSHFTADEYWLLKTGYQSAGVGVTTVIREPAVGEEEFESLAAFKKFVKTSFGTTYSSYEVTGCNYYHGEDPPIEL